MYVELLSITITIFFLELMFWDSLKKEHATVPKRQYITVHMDKHFCT